MRTSAANPGPLERDQDALRRAQRAHEPSMEEILASIRTIIAEERQPERGPEAKTPAPPAAPAAPQIVYSKAEPARPPAEPARSSRPDAAPEPGATKAPPPRPPEAEPAEPAAAALLSEEAERAVASSFDALSANLARRATEVAEGVAREMIRPMLKAWLDENLPAIVERLVKAEIERISREQR